MLTSSGAIGSKSGAKFLNILFCGVKGKEMGQTGKKKSLTVEDICFTSPALPSDHVCPHFPSSIQHESPDMYETFCQL